MNTSTIDLEQLEKPKQLLPLVRHLSWRLTLLLIRLPLTPNHITGLALVLGICGAGFFIVGDWTANILGALLLVLSYVLDNCDGEVARIKNLSSEFGARLDDFTDSSVDTCFFLALGYGTANATGESFWLWLGIAAALGAFIDFCIEQYKENRLKGMKGVKTREEYAVEPKQPQDWIDWLIYIFHELSRTDFCMIILGLTLFDVIWVLLPLAAVGAQIYWITDLSDRTRGYHT